ncbi:MAG: antibiotic biosynthesis monooxygenase [Anaerolineae bacterium]|jgi:quinol monooxygenase YgiN|nr:antibiotic biosynthesis monooxygenase [Anaerolineae bacterium]
MHIVVYTYRARVGQEDAIVALHESWDRAQHAQAQGYLSGELMRAIEDPGLFVEITRYENADVARAAAADPEQAVWRQRLASLTEEGLQGGACGCVWRSA